MALELEALLFSVDSKPLEEAINKANQLTQAVQNLNKASQDSTKAAIDEAKVRVQLAKVAAEEAKAKQQIQKAGEAENKTKEAKLRLSEKEEKIRNSNEAAIKRETEAQVKQLSILEKQIAIRDFQAQGFSKGQSGVLAMAQAAGLATNQMQELMEVLKQQRTLMGGNPFDKSQQGLISLKNQYMEVTEAIRQYNLNSGLTKKDQARELARDKERIRITLENEGKAIHDIVLAQTVYANKYTSDARKLNELVAIENKRERGLKDQANALKAVEAAEERMKNSLAQINSYQGENIRLNERAALAMGTYERNLRIAGITGEEATRRLKEQKAAQEALTEAEKKRSKDHLARGMSTQLGDVGISLWSGQNPLTVMLQQGDQMRGLITQSGLQAEEMKTVMSTAFAQIAGSFKMLGTAVGSFAKGAVVSLGEFILSMSLVDWAGKAMEKGIIKLFGSGGKIHNAFTSLKPLLAGVLGTVSAGLVALTAVIAVEFFKIAKHSDDMIKSISMFGAAQGLTLETAKQKAAEFAESNKVSYASAMEMVTAFSKSGINDMSSYGGMVSTAIMLQKEFEVSAEKSVEKVKELHEKPLESITKTAIETGKVNVATLEKIRLLEEEGLKTEAVNLAMESYQEAMEGVKKKADKNLSPMALFFRDLKESIDEVVTSLQEVADSSIWTKMSSILGSIKSASNTIYLMPKKVVESVTPTRNQSINSATDGFTDNYNNTFAQNKNLGIGLDPSIVSAIVGSVEATADALSSLQARQVAAVNAEFKKIREKEDLVKPSRYTSEKAYIKDAMAKKEKDTNQREQGAWDMVSSIDKANAEAFFGREFRDAHKGKSDAEKETSRLEKARIQDTKSLMDIGIKYEGHLEKLTDAEIRYNQIVSHEDYSKKYNTKALQEQLKVTMEIAKAREQAAKSSKLAMEIDKDWAEVTKQFAQQQISVDQRNLTVDNELRLVGLVGKEREKATREIELQNKYLDEQSNYERNRLAIVNKYVEEARKIDKEGTLSDAQRLERVNQLNTLYLEGMQEAERLLAEGRLVAQREVNKKVTEDWFKEFNRITDGLTDVLVTALTEGGAKGGKKFREMIQAELKKPFVAVLNAIVRDVSMIAANAVGIAPAGVSTGSSILGLASTSNSAYNLYNGSTMTTTGTLVGKTFGGSAFEANPTAYTQGFSNGLTNAPKLSEGYGEAYNSLIAEGNTEAALAYQKAQEAAQAGESAGATANTAMTYAAYAYALYALSKGDYKTAGGTAGAAYGAQVGTNIMPGWGTAIGAVVGYLAGSALGSSLMGGGKKTEGWTTGTITSNGVLDTNQIPSNWQGSEGDYGRNQASSQEVYDALKLFEAGVAGVISSTAKGLGGTAEGVGLHFGFNYDAKGNASDNISGAVYNKSGDIAYQHIYDAERGSYREELQKESQRVIIAALKQIDLVDWADSVLAAIDPLKATAEELTTAITNLTSMKNLVGIFEGLGLKADNLSMSFVNLFGGFEGATKAINDYYETYYTEEEKRARIVKNITTTILNAGGQITEEQVGTATKEEFRKLYEGIVEAQGAGSTLATAMLSVASTFAGIAVASDKAKTSVEALKDTISALGDFEKVIVDESDKMKQKAIDAAKTAYDNLANSVNKEKAKLKDSYDLNVQSVKDNLQLQLDAYAIQLDAANNLLSSTKSIADKLKSALDSVVDDSYSAQLQRFKQAVSSLGNIASTNDILNPNLDNILSTVQGDTKQFFGSYFEYAKNQALVKNDIDVLSKSADKQVVSLDSVVKGIEAAKKAAQDTADKQLKVLKDTYEKETSALDTILENAKSQLDALSGINSSVLSLGDALNAFAGAISGALATSQYASQQSIQAGMNTAYKAISGGIAAPSATVENLTKNKAVDRLISPSADTRLYVSSLGAGATLDTITGADNFVTRTGESMSVTEAAKVLSGAVSGIDTGKYSARDVVNAAKYYGLSQQAALDLYNVSQVQNGSQTVTMENFNAWLTASGIPAFADGGSYQGGLALVGENGPEMINFNQPGQVYNSTQTSEILNSSNKDLITEVKALRDELEMLRYESRATAINTAKMAKQIDRSASSNDALKVQIVT